MVDATNEPDGETVLTVGAPFNWCDRQCERCPVAQACSVWQAVHAQEEATADVARTEGIDLEESLPPRPTSLFAERLRRAGRDVSQALLDLLESPAARRAARDAERAEAGEAILHAAFLIPAKVSRVATFLCVEGAPSFDPEVIGDASANLILLEHVDASLLDALDRLGVRSGPVVRAFRRAHARLARMLAPLRASLPIEPRVEIATLVAGGHAPSPFCVRAPA